MTCEFRPYQPTIPIEARVVFGTEITTWNWYPYPSKHFWNPRPNGRIEVLDISDEIHQFIRHPGLEGTLNAMDLTVGCRYPCQTCIRDSGLLSSTISSESIDKLTSDHAFSRLLADFNICVGYAAEPSDNPQFLNIISTLIQMDVPRDYRFDIRTNYRKQKEQSLSELLALSETNRQINITVSLPLNRDDTIQKDFAGFKQNNEVLFKNASVFDLQHPLWQEIERLGRILPEAKESSLTELETFQTRGYGGLLLNPEGLWFMINATKYEAHTPEIYTLITAQNIEAIASNIHRLQESTHKDFDEAMYYKQRAEQFEKPFNPRIS